MRIWGKRVLAIALAVLLFLAALPVMAAETGEETLGQSHARIPMGTSAELKGSFTFSRVDIYTGKGPADVVESFELYKITPNGDELVRKFDLFSYYLDVEKNYTSIFTIEGLELGNYYIKMDWESMWRWDYEPMERMGFEITPENLHVSLISYTKIAIEEADTWMWFTYSCIEDGRINWIEGAEFWLYRMDEDGEFIYLDTLYTYSDTSTVYGFHSIDENNWEFTMPAGYYMLVQKSCPEGYMPMLEPFIFYAYSGSKVGTPIELRTERVPGYGGLEVQKLDAEKEMPLSGAVFELYYQLYDSEVFIGRYTTGSDGKISMEGLMPGDYRLVETQAPEGYLLPEKADREQYFSMVFDAETRQVLSYQGEATGLLTVYNRKKEIPPPVTEPENPGTTEPENPGTTEPEKPGITEPEKPDTTRPGGNGGGDRDKDPGTDVPDDHSKKDNSKSFGGSVTISEEDVPLATQLITLIDEEDVPISNVDIPDTGAPAGSVAALIMPLSIAAALLLREQEK